MSKYENEPLWDVEELAKYLQIPVHTLYKWRMHNQGPPALKLGKHLRWKPNDVYLWVETTREGE